MKLNEESLNDFFKIEKFTDKGMRIVFRTTSLNLFAMKSIALNIEKMFEMKRTGRAMIVRLAIFSLFKGFKIKEFNEYRTKLKSDKKTSTKPFSMYLDDQSCKNIDKLIVKERKRGVIISRNEVLNIACAMFSDNWLEIKKEMNIEQN